MSSSNEAVALIEAVGKTMGFKAEELKDGSYKLIRLPMKQHGVPPKTTKVSPRAQDQQLENARTRLRRIGWTQELADALQTVSRKLRLGELTDKEATRQQNRLLLESFKVRTETEPADSDTDDTHASGPVRRHAGGGSAAGSARRRKPATEVAEGPPQDDGETPIILSDVTVRMQAELITPERAVYLLANAADYQRPLRQNKVRDHAAAMARGEWKLNAAGPLCVDVNGQVANGQHRLNAVLECMEPQPFWVAYDTPVDEYSVWDRGTRRTVGDMLASSGHVAGTALAATAKLAHLWFNVPDQSEWKVQPEISEQQIFTILEEHPGLTDSVKYGRITGLVASNMRFSPAGAMFIHYLITRACDGDRGPVTRWYKAIGDMALRPGDPGHTLGGHLLKMAPGAKRRVDPNMVTHRTQRELDMYLLVQAWNNTCRGKQQRSISWRPDFVIAEPIAPGPEALLPSL